ATTVPPGRWEVVYHGTTSGAMKPLPANYAGRIGEITIGPGGGTFDVHVPSARIDFALDVPETVAMRSDWVLAGLFLDASEPTGLLRHDIEARGDRAVYVVPGLPYDVSLVTLNATLVARRDMAIDGPANVDLHLDLKPFQATFRLGDGVLGTNLHNTAGFDLV